MNNNYQTIPIGEVKIGMYIKLNLSWFSHSFPTSSFKITNQKELNQLLGLNLEEVRYYPSKSDLSAILESVETPAEADASTPPQEAVEVHKNIAGAKRARLEKLKEQREEIARCREKFTNATNVVKGIDKNIRHSPAETMKEADKLVASVAETLLSENDTIMHLMQPSQGSEDAYYHTLNVSVLSMMIATNLDLSDELIMQCGVAGLFHDLGKLDIPPAILRKADKLSKAEQNYLDLHPEYGRKIANKIGMPAHVTEVIANHHEYLDGSGYPNKLKGDAITLLTRIVSIANTYDNYCNHIDPGQSMTPHEALSLMYTRYREKLDASILAILIKKLGVYPPGTLVRLSSEPIGLVINVNIGQPLRPCVLIYDEEIPKEDAIILDLAKEGSNLAISASIRPGQLSREVTDYLNPRSRINYYFDNRAKGKDDPQANANH